MRTQPCFGVSRSSACGSVVAAVPVSSRIVPRQAEGLYKGLRAVLGFVEVVRQGAIARYMHRVVYYCAVPPPGVLFLLFFYLKGVSASAQPLFLNTWHRWLLSRAHHDDTEECFVSVCPALDLKRPQHSMIMEIQCTPCSGDW